MDQNQGSDQSGGDGNIRSQEKHLVQNRKTVIVFNKKVTNLVPYTVSDDEEVVADSIDQQQQQPTVVTRCIEAREGDETQNDQNVESVDTVQDIGQEIESRAGPSRATATTTTSSTTLPKTEKVENFQTVKFEDSFSSGEYHDDDDNDNEDDDECVLDLNASGPIGNIFVDLEELPAFQNPRNLEVEHTVLPEREVVPLAVQQAGYSISNPEEDRQIPLSKFVAKTLSAYKNDEEKMKVQQYDRA